MKVYIDGDINRYFVQTLCMIFFPGEKFSDTEEETEDTPVVRLSVAPRDGRSYASATMKCRDGIAQGEGSADGEDQAAQKFASGAAMLDAGRRLFGDIPPWGMLTGVRPAKIARDLIGGTPDRPPMTREEAENTIRREYWVSPKKASLVCSIAERERELVGSLDKNTCSLYVSIPFCPTRCAYCSFVSYSTKRMLSMIPEYLERLERDIVRVTDLIKRLGQKVETVYIGGGTPGILDEAQLERLLCVIRSGIGDVREFTYEAGRPETVTAEKLRIARDYGVTRVSINPQTTNDTVLESIGRKHTAAQFYEAFDMAAKSGIPHINADLIAGLPGDSFTSFARSMDSVIGLGPDNVTVHTFCVKKSADIIKTGTEVYNRGGGDTFKSVDYAQLAAFNAGYMPYYIYRQKNTVGNFENVGFAKPGAEGLYNILIMEEIHSIFAVGAGAVTKAVSPDRKSMERFFVPKYPYEYLRDDDLSEFEAGIERFYKEHF